MGVMKNTPYDDGEAPWDLEDGTINMKLKEEYDVNREVILHGDEEGI